MTENPLTSGPETPPTASAGQRFFAAAVDYSIWQVWQLVVIYIGAISGWTAFWQGYLWGYLLLPFVAVLLLPCSGFQTVGGRLAGITTVGLNGDRLSVGASIVRGVCIAVFAPCLWFAFLPAILGERRGLQDSISRSRVISIREPRIQPVRGGFAAIILLVVIRTVIAASGHLTVDIYHIASGSMEPTLRMGDRILVNKVAYGAYEPKNGDVALFQAPPAAMVVSGKAAKEKSTFIMRCIGGPGDVVEMRGGLLWRNGKQVTEKYTFWGPERDFQTYVYDMKIVGKIVYSRVYAGSGKPGGWSAANLFVDPKEQALITRASPGKVPPGQYLVLGDHRSNANDSHIWGFVPRANFIGKAMGVFWPLGRFRSLE